jgi:hypothetical protein
MIKKLYQLTRSFSGRGFLASAVTLTLLMTAEPLKVAAEELAVTSPIELEVRSLRSGQVESSITLSRDELLTEPLSKIVTTTPWTDGLQEFEGVPLKGLIHSFSEGAVVRLTALNDYTVTLPASELGDEYPIVAFRKNGKSLRIRDRGPFWIIYPFHQPEFQSEKFFAQSVWQLKTVDVVID